MGCLMEGEHAVVFAKEMIFTESKYVLVSVYCCALIARPVKFATDTFGGIELVINRLSQKAECAEGTA